jgi:uncharacterized protein (DUF885 family)
MKRTWILVGTTAALLAACSQDDGRASAPGGDPAAQRQPAPPTVEEVVALAATARADLDALLADEWEASLQLNPLQATFVGDHRFDDQLANSIGPEYLEAAQAHEHEYLARAEAIDANLLEGQDLLSLQLFLRDRNESIEGFQFPSRLVPINQFFSFPNFFAQLGSGASAHPFSTVEDYQNWLGRVDGFEVWMDQAIENMRRGLQTGITRPQVIMERVLPQLEAHLVDDPEQSLFYAPIRQMPEAFSEVDRTRLEARYREAITDQIIPAYRRMFEFIRDEYIPGAVETVGMLGIPGGADWYAYLVRSTTTTGLSPDQIHEIGLAEVERIHEEMRGVMAEVGFEGDLAAFFEFMRTDPQFYFESEDDLLAAYEAMREQAAVAANELFSLQPQADYEIRAVEAFRARSSSAASYSRAAPDGSRPGVFYVNTYDLSARPRYATEALFLHEAVPGHHFQIAIQQELGELPAFRRFGGYTAFTEGWGLYAESLGREMGFYADPYMYYGKLQAELWRAIRLVLDTGMHARGWTREQALEYAYANSDVAETRAVSEVERFIAIPSQALAYKIGQLKIQELRDRAEAAFGPQFDVRAFHAIVIGAGAVPLDVLEQRVDAWIDSR